MCTAFVSFQLSATRHCVTLFFSGPGFHCSIAMEAFRWSSFIAMILGIFQTTLVMSQETKYQCKGHEISFSQKQIDGMKKCGEVVGVKTKEEMTPEKLPCFAKCVMESSGLMDTNGKPHKEAILQSIEASITDDIKNAYKAAGEKCIDAHGQGVNPSDATCMSYAPLAMCTMKLFKEICHG